jgi:hypothetical protein
MELSDKAFNTLLRLRNFICLDNDSEIEQVCRELAEYLSQA